MDRKTVSYKHRTYIRLQQLGDFGDSFDSIANKLIDYWEKGHENKDRAV
jgi:hypothetical protein